MSTGVENTSGCSPINECAFATISSSSLMFSGYFILPCARKKTFPITPVKRT